jgi:hypothetical protein
MPAPRVVKPSLANLVDSDLEDDTELSIVANHPPTTKQMPPIKKGRGRPAAAARSKVNKVTKTANTATATTRRRSSGRIAAAVAATSGDALEILADRTNQQTLRASRKAGKATAAKAEDEDVLMMDDVPQKVKGARGRRAKVVVSSAQNGQGLKGDEKAAPTVEVEISEPGGMEVDEKDDAHGQLEDLPVARGSSLSAPSQLSRAPSGGRSQRELVDADMSDTSVRRRLGELSKKYDALESRFRQLQEVGTKEAEKNFDRLKKQTDERAQSKLLVQPLAAAAWPRQN